MYSFSVFVILNPISFGNRKTYFFSVIYDFYNTDCILKTLVFLFFL